MKYDFDIELKALRTILAAEQNFRHPYQPASGKQVRCIVVFLEMYLRERGYENKYERRKIRLSILSHILEFNVGTTYDLSAYQCSVLIDYFLVRRKDGTYEVKAGARN